MRLAFRRHDVGALRARRFQQAQRHDFRHHRDQQRALGMGGLGDGPQVADQAEHIGALHHHAGGLVVDQRGDVFGACPASPARAITCPDRPATVSTVSA